MSRVTLQLIEGTAIEKDQDGCIGCVFRDDESFCRIDMDMDIFKCDDSYASIWVVVET